MLLKEVKISNLLSFPYLTDIENTDPISFFSNGGYEGMRILIGNNASWKSNFVKIIEEFFSTFINDYHYTRIENDTIKTTNLQDAINKLENKTKNLHPHYLHSEKPSKIEIEIDLSQWDYDNLGFICKHHQKLNAMLKKYSRLELSFPAYSLEELQKKSSTLKISASFKEKEQRFIIDTSKLSNTELFILQYLQETKLIQILITIFNEIERKKEEKKWYFLKKTFTIINTNNEYFKFNDFVHPENIINDIHYTRNSLSWYASCLSRIRSILENFSEDQITKNSTQVDTQEQLEESSFYRSLSKTIEKFLEKKLHIEYINKTINLSLLDSSKRMTYFSELSSWEKSLLMIIFALYGNNLHEGFLIINEPELHLHPQSQKTLAQTFEKISENINAQFIISTNSPLFINENNITNVYRVYKNEKSESKIICPKITVDYDDATLIHMLKFENLSKIFFVSKIILVEGDTDAYFFSYYLNYLKTLPERKEKIRDYEVININGKGSLHTWIRFLNKFNIKNFFIGDWDNTVDYWFFSKAELNKFYLLANKNLKQTGKHQKYTDYYNRLVKAILTFSPKKYKAIINGIEKLYKDNIFILKQWAIESYVSVDRKWLWQIANFCNHHFNDRLKDPNFKAQQEEILEIMNHIFKE